MTAATPSERAVRITGGARHIGAGASKALARCG